MAQFIARAQGSSNETTRLGGKASGASASAAGWDLGARVRAFHNEETGEDMVSIELFGGSNNRGPSVNLGTYRRSDYDRLIRTEQRRQAKLEAKLKNLDESREPATV